MAFHDLSRNKVDTVTHNVTSLLDLGPKLSPQADQFSLKNSEVIIARVRRDARKIWFILNNNLTEKYTVSPRLCRRNDNWEPSKVSGSIEGAIERFEQILKIDFASLKSTKSSNLTMVQKSSLNFIRN